MRYIRIRDTARRSVRITVDGASVEALEGDTVLTALLTSGSGWLRNSEFGDGVRAGFCLMGACQDCRVQITGRGSARACATLVTPGMEVTRR